MPDDRLRHDRDDVENLEDLIDARGESTSHIAHDRDAFGKDLEIPEDVDVDEALTFPHPKRKVDPNADVDLMGTPHKEDIDINWEESQYDMLPSDYMDNYDDAVTTHLSDDDDEERESVEELGDVTTGDVVYGVPIVTTMPKGFQPVDEQEPAEGRRGGELESAMDTDSDEIDEEQEDVGGHA